MNIEEVKKVMKRVCPEMLDNSNFMEHAVNKYCNGDFTDVKVLSNEEYKIWLKLHEVICTATVGQLVKYLKEHFKLTDKLCYMDCVEGLKNDCTYVTKKQLGDRFFYYIKKLKDYNMKKYNSTQKDEDNLYPYVEDNDVVVA